MASLHQPAEGSFSGTALVLLDVHQNIKHVCSAHDEAELEALKAAARERLAAGQAELNLGLGSPGPGRPLPIASSRMGHLVDAVERAYRCLPVWAREEW